MCLVDRRSTVSCGSPFGLLAGILVGVVALLLIAGTPSAGSGCGQQVIEDWADDKFRQLSAVIVRQSGSAIRSLEEIKAHNYNLDFKNPRVTEVEHEDPAQLLAKLDAAEREVTLLRERLKSILETALN